MTTNTAFGIALTRPFLEKAKIEGLDKVQEMVKTIKNAMVMRMNELDWIEDLNITKIMQEKINHTKTFIGNFDHGVQSFNIFYLRLVQGLKLVKWYPKKLRNFPSLRGGMHCCSVAVLHPPYSLVVGIPWPWPTGKVKCCEMVSLSIISL